MSFKFNWNFYDVDELQRKTTHALTESIAKTRRPAIMVQPLQIVGIDFGSAPPELKFVSIDMVGAQRAHIVFSLKYVGDASVSMTTSIEANPLREPYFINYPEYVRPKVLAATSSLVLPFRLHLHHLELESLVDVIYTTNGLVVNFQGEPVKRVEADSSLDMIPGVRDLISKILKTQLGEAFVEDIPETLWTLSRPDRHPPDPFLGPRRWSQQAVTHTRYASLVPAISFPAMLQRGRRPYDTFSLSPTLIKDAISSRAVFCAAMNRRAEKRQARSSEDAYAGIEGISNLFEEALSEASSTGTIGSTHSRGVRPRRRVISLRKITRPEEQQPPSSLSSSSTLAEEEPENSPRPVTPSPLLAPQPQTPRTPRTPQTPRATRQDDESAVMTGVDDLSPLRGGSTHANGMRRFSSPAMLNPSRQRRHHQKLRTSSLQETVKPHMNPPPPPVNGKPSTSTVNEERPVAGHHTHASGARYFSTNALTI